MRWWVAGLKLKSSTGRWVQKSYMQARGQALWNAPQTGQKQQDTLPHSEKQRDWKKERSTRWGRERKKAKQNADGCSSELLLFLTAAGSCPVICSNKIAWLWILRPLEKEGATDLHLREGETSLPGELRPYRNRFQERALIAVTVCFIFLLALQHSKVRNFKPISKIFGTSCSLANYIT